MQNSLKNKLFIILFTFILLTFVLCTSCFASYDFELEGKTYTVGDNLTNSFKYWCISYDYSKNWGGNYFMFLASDYPIIFNDYTENMTIRNVYSLDENGEYSPIYSQRFHKTDFNTGFTYEDLATCTKDDLEVHETKISSSLYVDFNPIYSTHEILSENGTVVFQGAPQVNQIPEITKTLVEQTTQVGMQPLTLIKTLLPIVIVTIVGLIGFWKAWQLLLKNLRKA